VTTEQILNGVLAGVLTIAITIGRIFASRMFKKHDELVARVNNLEKESVTHADLQRLEDKIDAHNKSITERLDRILERK
jgi:hypothetical protein